MTDVVSGGVIEFIKAVGAIITPIALAWIAYRTNQTHKAVNSTASLLAEKAVEKEKELTAERDKSAAAFETIARLRATAEGKQNVQDVKDAIAFTPPAASAVDSMAALDAAKATAENTGKTVEKLEAVVDTLSKPPEPT